MAAKKKVAKKVAKKPAAKKPPSRARSEVTVIVGRDAKARSQLAKTMAREIGKDLLRVDIGQLVTKYIGETEKALAAVLARAEGRDVVLFFDEADALFGKRTDVKDAHDKYANLEVSYLLGFARLTPQVEAFADNLLRAKPPRKKKEG
jgi:SpoVK/Ycf46/Vps4 family AAA+-type ATPase